MSSVKTVGLSAVPPSSDEVLRLETSLSLPTSATCRTSRPSPPPAVPPVSLSPSSDSVEAIPCQDLILLDFHVAGLAHLGVSARAQLNWARFLSYTRTVVQYAYALM